MLKMTAIGVLAMFLTACVGFSVDKHTVGEKTGWNLETTTELQGVMFKTVELYKFNLFGPSFTYHMLYQCDTQGNKCTEVVRTPVTTPGMVASLIAPAIQAGAIIGAAAIMADGIRDSRSTTNVSNGSSSNSGSLSLSNSKSSSNSNSNANAIGLGGQGGQGGKGGDGGAGGVGIGGNSTVNNTNNNTTNVDGGCQGNCK